MPRLVVISVDSTALENGMLDELKQYASIPDGGNDAVLLQTLKNAALRVQEYADRPFLPTQLRVSLTVPVSGIVSLYMGGGTIEEVVDEEGNAVEYVSMADGRLRVGAKGKPVVITYTTEPTEADVLLLKQTVIRYATADFDGAETQELNHILTEARV